jgi:hypothetical protein
MITEQELCTLSRHEDGCDIHEPRAGISAGPKKLSLSLPELELKLSPPIASPTFAATLSLSHGEPRSITLNGQGPRKIVHCPSSPARFLREG